MGNKLKTLKDIYKEQVFNDLPDQIDLGYEEGRKDLVNDLKQETIKWVKSNDYMLNDCDGVVEDWIKYFFNLTEEDLK